MNTTIPNTTAVGAEVNAPRVIILYDENGQGVQVDESQKAYWIGKGFSETPLTPDVALEEFKAANTAMLQAVDAYVEDAQSSGAIDHRAEAARHTAYLAMVGFERAWAKLRLAMDVTYPNLEVST